MTMTRLQFRPTHTLRLTNRHRRGSTADQFPPPLEVRVMLLQSGYAPTDEEWRHGVTYPEWTHNDTRGWAWRGWSDLLPDGYTDLRVRRITARGKTARGPTVTRSPTETTAEKLTVTATASEIAAIREAARLDGKRPGPWVRDQVVPVARARVERKR